MLKNMDTADFRIRPYSKQELAGMYFPEVEDPDRAVRKLRYMMHVNRPLMDELNQLGYNARCRYFTARQVGLLVHYQGEP